jgi:hypothetical protein
VESGIKHHQTNKQYTLFVNFCYCNICYKKSFNEHYGTVKPVFRGHPWEKEKIAL